MSYHSMSPYTGAPALTDPLRIGTIHAPVSTTKVARPAAGEAWRAAIRQRLSEFVRMPSNWDGYGAPVVSAAVAALAFAVLEDVMRPGVPLPHVVPSSTGGVQIEWHERDIDLELHVAGPYNFELWFEDSRHEHPSRGEDLTTSLASFRDALGVLASR